MIWLSKGCEFDTRDQEKRSSVDLEVSIHFPRACHLIDWLWGSSTQQTCISFQRTTFYLRRPFLLQDYPFDKRKMLRHIYVALISQYIFFNITHFTRKYLCVFSLFWFTSYTLRVFPKNTKKAWLFTYLHFWRLRKHDSQFNETHCSPSWYSLTGHRVSCTQWPVLSHEYCNGPEEHKISRV